MFQRKTPTLSQRSCSTDFCPAHHTDSCHRCDVILGIDGAQLLEATRQNQQLVLAVETVPGLVGCPGCGVVAESNGRRIVELVDAPWAGVPVRLRWHKRRGICHEPLCEVKTFTEDHPPLCAPRAKLTTRCIKWAIDQLRREHASIRGLARQLGVSWDAVWDQIRPVLEAKAADESRFAGVTTLGVDEHIWHHTFPHKGKGPKEFTGMVDLTTDDQGRLQARLLDLVPGRSGPVYGQWLQDRGPDFRHGIAIAPLDPFRGYKNAIDTHLEDAAGVLDHFHIIQLANKAVDEVRRRVQHETLGRRGRKGDPLYGILRILRTGVERLRPKQWARLEAGVQADARHQEVLDAYLDAQNLRAAYRAKNTGNGRRKAQKILRTFYRSSIPEIARLGRTLRRWTNEFLAYFNTGRASNGGTEAINGLIELHRRVARGFRNPHNYRLRMLLIAGGLDHQPHP